jgi:hypothetical protein
MTNRLARPGACSTGERDRATSVGNLFHPNSRANVAAALTNVGFARRLTSNYRDVK